MADGLYVGMTAAVARAQQLDSIADNLANAQTPGFKASRPSFQAFLPEGAASSEKISTAAVATAVDLRSGPVSQTGRALDVLPDGDRFLTVRRGSGELAYTRDGALTVDEGGQVRASGEVLVDPLGHPLTVPPGTEPTIDAQGQLLVGGRPAGRLALAELSGNIEKLGGALLAPGAGGAARPVEGTVRTGLRELGNAPALEAAVQLISAQRNFDGAMQAITTYRRLDERAAELGRIR